MIRQKQIIRERMRLQLESADFEYMDCNETLEDCLSFEQPNHLLDYQCSCCGNIKTEDLSPMERKRLKRKQNRQKRKQKQKQVKEQAFSVLEEIIRDIYELRTTFDADLETIQHCLSLIQNQQRFFLFIDYVIREQVDAIKDSISTYLQQLTNSPSNINLLPKLYDQFTRIKKASPEVEKVINLFIEKTFKTDGRVVQNRNLDRKTFKFILRHDQNRNRFKQLCLMIITDANKFEREKHMMKIMLEFDHNLHTDDDDSDFSFQEEENSTSHSSEESERSHHHKEKNKGSLVHYHKSQHHSSKQHQQTCEHSEEFPPKSSKPMKRQPKEQIDLEVTEYDLIAKRIDTMQINHTLTAFCNVQEDWLQKLQQTLRKHT